MDVNVVSCVNSEGCASCESWVQFTCGKGQRNRGPREHPTQNPLGFPNRSMLPLKAARMVAVLEEPSTVTLATSMTRLEVILYVPCGNSSVSPACSLPMQVFMAAVSSVEPLPVAPQFETTLYVVALAVAGVESKHKVKHANNPAREARFKRSKVPARCWPRFPRS